MIKIQFIDELKYKNCFGIYGIKNKINSKIYVGQTGESFIRRYWHHNWLLKNNKHDNRHLQSAWNKYGESNFIFYVIEIVDSKSLLDDLEIKYIKYYKELKLSYNILDGGGGHLGVPINENAKRIIGEKNRKNMLGKKHSEKTKIKMSIARKGKHQHRSSDKITENDAYNIKKLLIQKYTPSQVSKILHIDYKLINNILSNNTWSHVHVDGWNNFLNGRKTFTRLSKADHKEIYRLYTEKNMNKYELANMYGKTVKMIEKIIRDQKSYDNPVPSLK